MVLMFNEAEKTEKKQNKNKVKINKDLWKPEL